MNMCLRPNSEEYWLYHHGFSHDNKCGPHPSWIRWNTCLPNVLKSRLSEENFKKTKYFYITFLRDPFDRYLSEFKQILRSRDKIWREFKFECKTKTFAPYKTLSACHKGPVWINLTFPKFIACPDKYNLAFNRQTRMLANLTEVECQNNQLVYGEAMLESAKRNLRSMAFYGLAEYQEESRYLFEKTFGLKFKRKFAQEPVNNTYSYNVGLTLTRQQKLRVREATELDRQLYNYAKTLFLERLAYHRELEKMNESNRWQL